MSISAMWSDKKDIRYKKREAATADNQLQQLKEGTSED